MIKKVLRILLVLAVVGTYGLSKIQRIHRNSETVSKALKNSQMQTETINKNTTKISDNNVIIEKRKKENNLR